MKSDWIKQSCSFNWSKETCVGRAGSPLASVGFCSEFWNVLPHSSSGLHLQLQLSLWAFAFHLTQEKRLKKRKRIYILCSKYYQGHTLWFREKKKTKEKMQIWSFSFIFRRELYSSGVSLLAHNGDISVHLIRRSLRSVQRFSVSSADFAAHWAGAPVLLINLSVLPVPRP